MIRLHTGNRLHFGLFNVGAAAHERRFGGVGLMIDGPGLELTATPAATWSATGPLAERVTAFVEHARQEWHGVPLQPLAFHVRQASAEHVGLGTGTQLGLAVARALQLAGGQPTTTAAELARLSGRGERSALGVHGFLQGGFLVEAGQRAAGCLSPLIAHQPFPEEWRILLVRPTTAPGVHGESERRAFRQLLQDQASQATTERLCRLTLLGMLPALVERDLERFGEALYEFNRLVGELFASVQGGVYAAPEIAAVVQWLRTQRVHGVGQSSWGPTVFAIVEAARSEEVCAALAATGYQVLLTRPLNQGARQEGTV